MLLSKETAVRVTGIQSNIISHLGYAAYKLWNVCNYERNQYDPLSGNPYPDWYYQKSAHKDDLWYKSLPSQTAQEICKQLDKSWKSFYALLKSGGIENPNPPRYKHEPIPVTYMQNGIKRLSDTVLRLSLPKALKQHLAKRYDIHEDYLIIENGIFADMDVIKQVKLYMPEEGIIRMIVAYEVPDVMLHPDNGHYLSVDPGVHNLLTCYDSDGSSFIIGRQYLSIARKYDKEISRVQSRWAEQQVKRGERYPKPSKHVLSLYRKKQNSVKDYLHKVTHGIVSYCQEHEIHTVVMGDITGIRSGKDNGDRINQELHALPYRKITQMLQYKLAMQGIRLISVKEAYSSQCSPLSPAVSREYAEPKKRIKRGLYTDGGMFWNADCVGAYNILRLYLIKNGKPVPKPSGLSNPYVLKVAA